MNAIRHSRPKISQPSCASSGGRVSWFMKMVRLAPCGPVGLDITPVMREALHTIQSNVTGVVLHGLSDLAGKESHA